MLRLLVVLLVGCHAVLSAAFPQPHGPVTDLAGLLDANQRARIERLLADTKAATTAEIALVTVTSLDGMSVEEYAARLFMSWGIGHDRVDNGVLVLVAPTEREMRIEVGYGLEEILPDGLAGNIIRTQFLPRFRDDDYAGGIEQGMQRVVDIVRRNQILTAAEREALLQSESDSPPALVLIPFLGIFVGLGGFFAGVGLRVKVVTPILFGAFFAGIALLMGLAAYFAASLVVLGPWAAVMMLAGYSKGDAPWAKELRKGSDSKAGPNEWVMSGTSSRGNGTSSSDGFSGGSSGGGGASGRW
jgi:uncharacterized protein